MDKVHELLRAEHAPHLRPRNKGRKGGGSRYINKKGFEVIDSMLARQASGTRYNVARSVLLELVLMTFDQPGAPNDGTGAYPLGLLARALQMKPDTLRDYFQLIERAGVAKFYPAPGPGVPDGIRWFFPGWDRMLGRRKPAKPFLPDVIKGGKRHQTLLRMAGALRGGGAPESMIHDALMSLLPRCEQPPDADHPFTEDDVAKISHGIMIYPAEPGFPDLQ